MAMRQERRTLPPLDAAALERMALRYVERFATTRGKLADYLRRKIRERGWDGEAADPQALAQRMADLGYVDDRLYAESKAAALTRRGLGARRVTMALRHAHVGEADTEDLAPAIHEQAVAAALTFARRKRIGPFGPPSDDRAVRDKQLAALLRAGHAMDLSRRIVAARDESELGEIG
ncbi:RecX family transcriptional regulator [Sphingomonas sp. CD22]|jgi:regulatory protein|uniref:regulatory protein RecX n=1 Tax=Sphingomonas sp. CD22 TaxID=3100214 RepID=UPI002AE022FD|nr:RecX family transcriptional regulator [Sphingomonas sp. CD22]MEA1084131.1 RecX family transcriptional regulator [Sphingomonas sp. CD22]